jgi:hypothetical protein
MLKIIIKKYMTLYEFIKQIKKGKYNNQTKFIYDGEKYDIDDFFYSHHCNFLNLNEEIEILKGENNG